jgi:SAM-dependent methyltransferase
LRDETAQALREVNRRFYQERASEFSRTRERPWSGWGEILDRLGTLLPDPPRVLDVGCGNGRFARFLEERLGGKFDYCGVDESALALAEAKKRLPSRENVVLVQHDFLESAVPTGLSERKFDLVALFGVLHHVPGRKNRLELMRRLEALLAPRGLLAFSIWRFDRLPRFQKKVVPWAEFLARTGVGIDVEDLEPGDYILTWGAWGDCGEGPTAYRFCHQMSEEEEEELQRLLPAELLLRLDAAAEPNRYFVFRYPQTA